MSGDHDEFLNGSEPEANGAVGDQGSTPHRNGGNSSAAPAEVEKIRFTVFEAHGARLSKEYKLFTDGSVDSDGGTELVYGSFHVRQFDTAAGVPAALAEIGRLLEGLPPFAAIVLGVPKDGTTTGEIVTKERHAKGGKDAITRTLEHFGWPDGPGLLLFDGDGIDGLRDALCKLYPPLADAAFLQRPSASASVMDPQTGKALKIAEHSYVVIDDPSLSKDVLKASIRLAWCKGHGKSAGFPKLTKAGSVLPYGPVDVSVGSPERLSYEGAAVVGKGLATLPRTASVIGGTDVLCAADLLAYADLHAPEAQFKALFEAAKLEPEFAAEHAKVKAKHRAELDKTSRVTEWRLHGLRRTAATNMQELGIRRYGRSAGPDGHSSGRSSTCSRTRAVS